MCWQYYQLALHVIVCICIWIWVYLQGNNKILTLILLHIPFQWNIDPVRMCHIYPKNLFLYAYVQRGFRTDPVVWRWMITKRKHVEGESKKIQINTLIIGNHNHKFIKCHGICFHKGNRNQQITNKQKNTIILLNLKLDLLLYKCSSIL